MPVSQKPRNWKGRNRRRQSWIDGGRVSRISNAPKPADSKAVPVELVAAGAHHRPSLTERLSRFFQRRRA